MTDFFSPKMEMHLPYQAEKIFPVREASGLKNSGTIFP